MTVVFVFQKCCFDLSVGGLWIEFHVLPVGVDAVELWGMLAS